MSKETFKGRKPMSNATMSNAMFHVSCSSDFLKRRLFYVKRDVFVSKETLKETQDHMSKETSICLVRQPYSKDVCMSKETYVCQKRRIYVKRNVFFGQKRRVYVKTDESTSKET